MAGPTPVSALIHAATMVTAGVYMVARLHAVYRAVAGRDGDRRHHRRGRPRCSPRSSASRRTTSRRCSPTRRSASSASCSPASAPANFDAGVFHLFTHAFFKAGLFLCAGSVMHAMSGSGDITRMGGLRKKIPRTHGVFFVCWLAISGLPCSPASSRRTRSSPARSRPTVYRREPGRGSARWSPFLLLAAALGTAFYMLRLYFLVFSGRQPRRRRDPAPHPRVARRHGRPAGAAGDRRRCSAALVGIPGALFEHPELNCHRPRARAGARRRAWRSRTRSSGSSWAISTALAGGGIALACVFYGGGYREPAHRVAFQFPRFVALVRDKFRIDELYDVSSSARCAGCRSCCARFVDRILIDKILVEGTGAVVDLLGRIARFFQNGDAQRYMAAFAIGVAALVFFASRPPAPSELKVSVDGLDVQVDARRAGAPVAARARVRVRLRRRPRGEPDRARDAPRLPTSPGGYTIRVTVTDPRWGTSTQVKRRVEVQ